jgi:hypothetical protein
MGARHHQPVSLELRASARYRCGFIGGVFAAVFFLLFFLRGHRRFKNTRLRHEVIVVFL